MSESTKKAPKRARIVLGIIIAILAVLAIAAFCWVNNYYHADEAALAIIADENGAADGVVVEDLDGEAIAFVPDHPVAGLVFYPGGKVQPEAYAPLMQECAERGILCVIVKFPFNLAFFNMSAADGVKERFPDVKEWVIAGHSLGGVAACNYVSKHASGFEGVALLASFPVDDLSSYGGNVITLVGSEDHVINRTKLEDAAALLPDDAELMAIEGGNHAGFGNYGKQDGDGAATISSEQQQKETADAIEALVKAA